MRESRAPSALVLPPVFYHPCSTTQLELPGVVDDSSWVSMGIVACIAVCLRHQEEPRGTPTLLLVPLWHPHLAHPEIQFGIDNF